MTAQHTASIIHRKARAARDGSDARAMSPAKALRLSLARAADTLFDLALTVATVEQRRLSLGLLVETVSDEGLILLLDGAGGARGAVVLDSQMMAALIEVQTTGTVRPGVAPARRATRTDAAMVAPLVDALLDGIDAEMTAGVEGYVPRGFRFGDRMEDLRALGLALDAPEFDLYRVTADLGPGVRTGRLDLLMPARRAVPPNAPDEKGPGTRAAHARMSDVALGAPVVLDAVMARISLPLREACALSVGQVLPLTPESLGAIQLTGAGAHLVAEARLGQLNGWRALRLVSSAAAPLPEMAVAPEPPEQSLAKPPSAKAADKALGTAPATQDRQDA
ncbi:surface presentation of antigens [Roseovarius sp. A-2]|uniref:FliM/FliN family flagellar motor C-terminal domain-containing protein n=1 Tax=Roseovarius sp. A-2 TaxID=1570360 RepID=UPI0009B50676|nr:FliM/FliN family flagellar motor C-terminal domain-containing protein [Roseovarius sp. A-2]GAW33732.1 surface presentation of antigens [Roseovarius sp. A-2]